MGGVNGWCQWVVSMGGVIDLKGYKNEKRNKRYE